MNIHNQYQLPENKDRETWKENKEGNDETTGLDEQQTIWQIQITRSI